MSSNNKEILYGTLIAVILVASIVTVVVMTQNKDDDTDSTVKSKSKSKFRGRLTREPLTHRVGRLQAREPPRLTSEPLTHRVGRLQAREPFRQPPRQAKEPFRQPPRQAKEPLTHRAGRLQEREPPKQPPRLTREPLTHRVGRLQEKKTVEPYGPRARPKGLTRESFAPKERFAIAECPCSSEHAGECPSGCNCSKCNTKESYKKQLKYSKKYSKTDDPYVFVDQHLGDAIGGIGSAIKNDLRGSGAADSIRSPIVILSPHAGHGDDSWFVPAQFGRAPAPHAAKWIM